MFTKKVLSRFELLVDFTLLGCGREGGVDLFGFVCDMVRFAAFTEILFLEVGEEAVPVFVLEGGVLGEFAFDHEFLGKT